MPATGRAPAMASRMPPAADTTPNTAASTGTAIGPLATRIAAAQPEREHGMPRELFLGDEAQRREESIGGVRRRTAGRSCR